jgi:hypothetical protein
MRSTKSDYITKLLPEASHSTHVVVHDRYSRYKTSVHLSYAAFPEMALLYIAPIVLLALKATAVNNGLAKTPQMGWVRFKFHITRLTRADLTIPE